MQTRSLEQRLDAYLALERLTLGAISQSAGLDIDWSSYREGLLESIQIGVVIDDWRGDRGDESVIALATFKPVTDRHWFASMLTLHPDHRGPKYLLGFLQKIQAVLEARQIVQLSSHVLKNNTASIALHQTLGFKLVQENDLALAFELSLPDLHWPALHKAPATAK